MAVGGIALLVPREEMRYQAHNVLQEKSYDIDRVEVVKTEGTIVAARTAIADGAKILIARGLQASLIKQYTDVPVAEITVTAQEMGLLVVRAKEIVKKETPVIGVVGFRNMFSDMTYFNTLYEIELRTYFAATNSQLEECALEAAEDQVDLLIGGEVAMKAAKERGIPSLFLSTTEDSLRRAFDVAQKMLYVLRQEQDSVNASQDSLTSSLEEGLPSYYRTRKPVLRREIGRRRPALIQFTDLTAFSSAMAQCVERAAAYAKLDAPVLIQGEPGTEKMLLAQCIHNASPRNDASFFWCSCTGSEEEQTKRLFGPGGIFRQASGGSVYLTDLEALTPYQQFGLYQVMRTKQLPELTDSFQDEKRGWPVNVRVMASLGADLETLSGERKIMPELAALFGGLVLEVPPLRKRPEDLEAVWTAALRRADECLGAYHVFSEEAKQVMASCSWSCNTLQVEAFCSRLAVEARRRTVSGAFVKQLYSAMYPTEADTGMGRRKETSKKSDPLMSEEEALICRAWVRQSGSRQKMAKELGMSTSTLWRKMKKYGLTDETLNMKHI